MNYEEEKLIAKEFKLNANDSKLDTLLLQLESKQYTHSDRWSIIYGFIQENYPDADSQIITGLAYLVEEKI